MKAVAIIALALVACAMAAEEPERVKKDTVIGYPYGLGYMRSVLPGMTAYPYGYNYGAYPYAYNYGAYPHSYNYGAYPYSGYYGNYMAGRTIVY